MRRLIAFSGLDGAGKTTQIDLLKKYYDDHNIKCEVVWSRGGYTKGMERLKSVLRTCSRTAVPQPGKSEERTRQFKKSYIRKAWLLLSIFDLFFLYCIVFRIKSAAGITVIADRYLVDTGIDFARNFPEENVEGWPVWRLLKWCAPRPYKHFIGLLPVGESQRRSELKDEPFPDSEENLRFRTDRYQQFIQQNLHVIRFDGRNRIGKIHADILKELGF